MFKVESTDTMDTQIEDFYAGRNIFITGATGFVGKVLVEKLLRSCPEIGKIYILLREKRGKSLKERMQVMFNDPLYDTLKAAKPNIIDEKVVPVKGNCMELQLGLSPEDRSLITETVSVIYHVAASVRFDDSLKDAIILNTRGTRELAQLALETKQLAVLVHVSTTYCNCVYGKEIYEKLYEAPTDWRKAIEIAEKFDPNQLSLLSMKYLGPYPNTYTFTKALGEHVINDMCQGKIPTLICRPSIVISTLDDPIKGWIDNFNGPVGLLIACAKGLLRSSYLDKDVNADYIPVDVTVKVIIVAAWNIAVTHKLDEVEVMHSSSGYIKWMTMGEMIKLGRTLSKEVPMNDCIWVPKGFVTKCPLKAYINTIFFHLLPAFFLDLGIQMAGHKPILKRLQMKIYNASIQLRYFTFQEWEFSNDKMFALLDRIPYNALDKWGFDHRNQNSELFMINCMIGARKYLLKESDESLPQAKIHYNRMYWVDKITMFLLSAIAIWIFYKLDFINVVVNSCSNWAENYFSLKGV